MNGFALLLAIGFWLVLFGLIFANLGLIIAGLLAWALLWGLTTWT